MTNSRQAPLDSLEWQHIGSFWIRQFLKWRLITILIARLWVPSAEDYFFCYSDNFILGFVGVKATLLYSSFSLHLHIFLTAVREKESKNKKWKKTDKQTYRRMAQTVLNSFVQELVYPLWIIDPDSLQLIINIPNPRNKVHCWFNIRLVCR